LAENRHKSLDIEALKHPESQTLQLLENTYKWLGEISSGISISASADASTQSAKLTYQYEYGGNTTSNYSPLCCLHIKRQRQFIKNRKIYHNNLSS
jgi:hypothetical protein